jgi:formamidopyrimidine-DNA glycosylase
MTGRTIVAAQVVHPRAVRDHAGGPADFAARLANRQARQVRRRGKYLWLVLDDDVAGRPEALLAHLGMSGQLVVVSPSTPAGPHLRARVQLAADASELRFVDQRTFGRLAVVGLVAGIPAPIAHLAPDPLEQSFDDDAFLAALRRRRTGLKRALLDQTLVSGIGNIYADEALWRARLHFAQATDALPRRRGAELLAAVRAVLGDALRDGGTSFDSLYVDVEGRRGDFGRSLTAYARAGVPCRRCGVPIRREAFMNRSSYRCPRCQRRPRMARY